MEFFVPAHGGELVNLRADAERAEQIKQASREFPAHRQDCDLDLLFNGAFAPLRKFQGGSDYEGVLGGTRLANRTLRPVAIAFEVPAKMAGYQAIRRHYPHQLTALSRLSLAMRMARTREVLRRVMVPRNYGCSPMVVGPKHAYPPLNSDRSRRWSASNTRMRSLNGIWRRARFRRPGSVIPESCASSRSILRVADKGLHFSLQACRVPGNPRLQRSCTPSCLRQVVVRCRCWDILRHAPVERTGVVQRTSRSKLTSQRLRRQGDHQERRYRELSRDTGIVRGTWFAGAAWLQIATVQFARSGSVA